MARGKKKESVLTPEGKLAHALVPESEQPYQVPENWCWARGSAIFKDMETRKPEGDYFSYIDIDAIDNSVQMVTEPKRVAVKDAPSRASRAVHYGDTVFSLVRPYLKNIAFIDEALKDCIASTGFFVCSPSPVISPRYLYWLMTSSYVVDGLNKYMKGDNSPSIRKDDIEMFAYPVAPFSEQQRIVDRIESLFAKLNEAKEKAQTVLDSFETRKAAILHKAFTGELTAKWRAEHGVGMESWEHLTYSDIGSSKLGKMLDKAKNEGVPTPYLRNINVRWFAFDLNDVSTMLASEAEIQALSVKKGDLFICEGGEPGRCAIWKEPDSNLIFQKALHRFRPNKKVISEFLCYNLFFMSLNGTLQKFFTGTTIKHLTGQSLAKIPVHLPSVSEQREIVRILDSLFAKEQQAKEAAEAVLEQIDTMKKSILARAFRGELGTNDPAEESAVELVKKVITANH